MICFDIGHCINFNSNPSAVAMEPSNWHTQGIFISQKNWVAEGSTWWPDDHYSPEVEWAVSTTIILSKIEDWSNQYCGTTFLEKGLDEEGDSSIDEDDSLQSVRKSPTPTSPPPLTAVSAAAYARWHIPVFVPVCWGPESRARFLFWPDSGGIWLQCPWCSTFSTGRNPTFVVDLDVFYTCFTYYVGKLRK